MTHDPLPTPPREAELHEHVQNAFIQPTPSTLDLLDAAVRSHARPVLLAALNRLPDRTFDSVADVVTALSEAGIVPFAPAGISAPQTEV